MAPAARTRPRYSVEEYLALERRAEHKSEYLDGRIYAMVGASRQHNRIVVNLVRELSNRLRGGRRAPGSLLRDAGY